VPASPNQTTTADSDGAYAPTRYAWYVVGVLTLANVSGFVDRQILSLLVIPIRRDLGISDTQMSVLMGLSFALFQTTLGVPIGRLADSHSRRTIIGVGVAVIGAEQGADQSGGARAVIGVLGQRPGDREPQLLG
jgi:MFS family permease